MRRTAAYVVAKPEVKEGAKFKSAFDNRDVGKQFLITEMPDAQAEEWAIRCFLALARSGVNIPDGIEESGFAGIASLGLTAISGLRWEDAKPLLDEMMSCVHFVPDPRKPAVHRPLFDGDIEEVSTRVKLRMEVWKLHTGFSMAASNPDTE